MKGHICDNCETHLDDSDYTSYGSWSYTCHTCGFTYRHGASPVQEQVEAFNKKDDAKNGRKMKISRFDNIEFRVLLCADGGYYPDGTPEADRAKTLMEEGIFNYNPVNLWSHSGYKGLTELGKKYYAQFLKKVRKNHGHVWKLNNHDDPKDKSEYGESIDIFAYSSGYHNGYECVKCGYTFCKHCETEFEVQPCSKK